MKSIELSVLHKGYRRRAPRSEQPFNLICSSSWLVLLAKSSPAFLPSPASSQYAAPESEEETFADPPPPPWAIQFLQTQRRAIATSALQFFSTPVTTPMTLSAYRRCRPSHRPTRDRTPGCRQALARKPGTPKTPAKIPSAASSTAQST